MKFNEEITAGLLTRRKVREALRVLKMYGNIEDFRESKSLLESTFFVKGADLTALLTFRDLDTKRQREVRDGSG